MNERRDEIGGERAEAIASSHAPFLRFIVLYVYTLSSKAQLSRDTGTRVHKSEAIITHYRERRAGPFFNQRFRDFTFDISFDALARDVLLYHYYCPNDRQADVRRSCICTYIYILSYTRGTAIEIYDKLTILM